MSLWGYLTGAKGPSGFGSASTAEQVATAYADQAKGKVVLITGATAGIGLEAARALAQQGAIVYIGARSEDKAAKAAETIRASAPQADVRPFIADLCSLQSVKTAVDKFLAEDVPLHILINNAGTPDDTESWPEGDGEELIGKSFPPWLWWVAAQQASWPRRSSTPRTAWSCSGARTTLRTTT